MRPLDAGHGLQLWALARGRSCAGVTLVEWLAAITIFTVISAAIFTSLTVGQRSFMSSDAYIQVQQEARRALDGMTRELREAGWDLGKPPGAIATAAGQIEFQVALGYNLPAPCPADAVCWGAPDPNGAAQPGWSVRYRLAGTQLLREIRNTGGAVPDGGTRVLANDVTQATFTYAAAAGTVDAQIQVRTVSPQLPSGGLSLPAPLTSRVKLRNP